MAKPTISSYLKDNLDQFGKKQEPGPFITISRQFGCEGYELARALLEKLNERDDQQRWTLYYKELLKQLAEDTGLSEEIIERERKAKPSLLKDFLRNLRTGGGIPDGYEIRNKITMMVRTVAFEGFSVIVGQGGAAATADLDGGLSIRVEAPKDWRLARICRMENLNTQAAEARMDEVEKERSLLRSIYEQQNPRTPAFNLIIDSSKFARDKAIELILKGMELRGLIPVDGD